MVCNLYIWETPLILTLLSAFVLLFIFTSSQCNSITNVHLMRILGFLLKTLFTKWMIVNDCSKLWLCLFKANFYAVFQFLHFYTVCSVFAFCIQVFIFLIHSPRHSMFFFSFFQALFLQSSSTGKNNCKGCFLCFSINNVLFLLKCRQNLLSSKRLTFYLYWL